MVQSHHECSLISC